MKKIIYIVSFLFLSFILVACDKDDIESFEVVTKNEIVELYQGETIDYNDFELILHYKDGSKKSIINEKELKAVKHNYNVYPNFNHFDPNDNEVIQEVIFEYKNFKTEIIPIKTKRLEVKKVTLLNIGKTSYQYGELFDPADFSVFVEFTNAPNRQLPLTIDMLNIESSQLKPEEIGTYYVDVAFNGVTANNPLVLNISKGERVLSKEDVKIVEVNENYIELEPIDNALYAFYKADEVPVEEDINWQASNIFQSDKLITDDYVVFVKITETKHYLESNIVSHYINYQERYIKPNVLYVGDDNIIVANVDGFDVVLLDENNKIVGRYYEVSSDLKSVKIDRLNPNSSYKLAFVRSGTNVVYEQNILDNLVKTKEGTNVIIAKHSQTNTFTNKKINYEYLINEKYNSDNLKVDIKYYNENNELVEPINAGTYKVVITNNFSSEKLERTLEIKKLDIELTINNVTKTYGDNDPSYEFEIVDNKNKEFASELDFEFIREEGENVGEYKLDINNKNDNFNVLVNDATLEILPRNLNITAHPATKIYGDIDPQLTFDIEGLQFEDKFVIKLSRQEGENVGTYNINLDSNNISDNYTIKFVASKLEILKRNISISTKNLFKTYGDNDPSSEFEIVDNKNKEFASELEFEFIREEGENVGTYKLDINNKNDNFNVILNNDYYLLINPLKIIVTINNIKVYYGTSITQSLFTNDLTEDKLRFNDEITDLGEIVYGTNAKSTEVGTYDIFVEIGYKNNNYEFRYVPGTIKVEHRPVRFEYEGLETTYDNTLKSVTVKVYDSITNEEIEDAVVSVEYDDTPDTPINAGVYQITATFSGSNMYKPLVDNSQKLVISKRVVQLTINNVTKTYGENDVLTYTLDNENFRENLNAKLSREDGENVGSYQIVLNSFNEQNFNVLVNDATLKILPRNLNITAHPVTKIYGDIDPQLTFDIEGLQFDEEFDIKLSRQEGENIGTYDINLDSTNISDNYTIKFVSSKLEILKRNILISTKNLFKTYGENDPSSEFEIVDNKNKEFASELDFEFIREEGENVGEYKLDINNKNNNFNVILNNDYYLLINPLEIVVTINDIKVLYGTSIRQSLFTNDLTEDKLRFNDEIADLGEIVYGTNAKSTEVGTYDIFVEKGYENNNYKFRYVPGTIKVEYKPVRFEYEGLETTYDNTLKSVTVKVYDSITHEEIEDADVSVEYDRTPINAGVYQITATFSGSNMYEDVVDNSQKLVILKRDVQLTFVESSLQKVYGEEDNIKYTLENVIVDDELDIEVIRDANENVGSYPITIKTNNNNYKINYENKDFEIIKKDLFIIPHQNSKVYGEKDPQLTFDTKGLIDNDVIIEITYNGKNVGTYEYEILVLENANNYKVTLDSTNKFTIEKRDLFIKPHQNSKVYGEEDPQLTFDIEGLQFDEEFDIILSRQEGENVGTYNINLDSNNISENYTINFVASKLEISKRNISISTKNLFKTYGDDDPFYEFEIVDNKNKAFESELDFEFIRKEGENVGTYKLDINNINDNFNVYLNNDYYLSINPLEIVVTINSIKVYYGTDITPDLFTNDLTDDKLRFNDKITDLGEIIYGTNAQSTVVDKYPIFVEKGYENNNYEFTYEPGTIEVEYKPVRFEYEGLETTYDNTLKSVTVKVYDSITNEEIKDAVVSVEYDGEPINAGVYQITATFSGSNMYEALVDNSQELVILQRELSIKSETLVYNGSYQNVQLIIDKIDNDDVSFKQLTVKDARTYDYDLDLIITGKDKDNYKYPPSIEIVVEKYSGKLIFDGDDIVNDLPVVEIDYTKNQVKEFDDFKQFQVFSNNKVNFTNDFKYRFDVDYLDLSDGASTFIVTVTAIPINPDNFSESINFKQDIVYKFKSVTIGNNDTFYTIEDALDIANNRGSGTIIVKSNTSFATERVNDLTYRNKKINISSNVKVVIPKNTNYKTTFEEVSYENSNAASSPRQDPFSKLTVKNGIQLEVYGEIFVNATRGYHSTNVTGTIYGNEYGVIYNEPGSIININSGGKYIIYGFSAGEGKVNAFNNSTVLEMMSIFDYKGGTITTNHTAEIKYKWGIIPTGAKEYADKPLPINYFAPLAISNITIHSGSTYSLKAFVTLATLSGVYYSETNLIGNNSLFNLRKGSVNKNVTENGRVIIETNYNSIVDFDGEMSLKIKPPLVDTITLNFNKGNSPSEIPFGAFYDIIINDNSKFNINAPMNIISGSTLSVLNNSTINVNHKLFIAGVNDYTNVVQNIPSNNIGIKNSFYAQNVTYDVAKKSLLYMDDTSIISFGANGKIGGTISSDINYNFVNLTNSKDQITIYIISSNDRVNGATPKVTYKLKYDNGNNYFN